METLGKWGSAPSVSGSGMARVLPKMSDTELSILMINSNRLAAVLEHLRGVIDRLQQVQFQGYTRRLTEHGELDSGEAVAARVAEETLDEEFGELEEFRLGGKE